MILEDFNYYSKAKKSGLNVEPVFERLITSVDEAFFRTNPDEDELSSYEANRINSPDTMTIKHSSLQLVNKKWQDNLDKYNSRRESVNQSRIMH